MHLDRLKTLRDLMAATPDDKIDMNYWRREPGAIFDPNTLNAPTCGTVACMLGWACMNPEFQTLGLHFEHDSVSLYPEYNGRSSAGAGAEFFDLEPKISRLLFDAASRQELAERGSHKAVALARLDELLETGTLHDPDYYDPSGD